MECKFVVGQKVVCVKGSGTWVGESDSGQVAAFRNGDGTPTQNGIYTISAIEADQGFIGLAFKGFPQRHWYDHRCFRPLQDRPKQADTDISVFTPLLNAKTPEPVT